MPQPQEHVLPRRVLVVDDDELVRDAIAALLGAAQFEVSVAAEGEEALTMMGRQWFPVVVTDRRMPVFDGIEFVSRLRAVSIAPVYVIMLTTVADPHDYERGYCAGVDLYVGKNGHDKEIVTKVSAAFSAVRRRQATNVASADRPITVDLASGAQTARHLVGRLHAEMSYATRTNKALHVLSACIEPGDQGSLRAGAIAAASDALLHAVHGAVRTKLDWIARLPAGREACRLAIVMPEADASQIAAVEQGVRNAFVESDAFSLRGMNLTFGVASLAEAGETPTALGLLAEAERQRRGVKAKASAAAGIKNIQEADAA